MPRDFASMIRFSIWSHLPGPFVIGMLPFAALLIAGVASEGWRLAGAARRGRPFDLGRPAVALLSVVAVLAIAPGWWHGDRALASDDAAAPTWQAEGWVA